MATIIVQGTKEETTKTISALKTVFSTVNKKACFINDTGLNTFIDAKVERCAKERYTDDEIDKGNLCCSSKLRNCADCPFSKEDDCQTVMIAEMSKMVKRLTGQLPARD